jgi:hypothetical protein
MRRMTEERQMIGWDGMSNAVNLERAWEQEMMLRARLVMDLCRSPVFRVACVDTDTCCCGSECSE